MAIVMVSNQQQQPQFVLKYADNIKWRKALNTAGYASFDLPLTDQFADPAKMNAGSYVHIFSDTANTQSYANADWGGILANDYEIKPKDGMMTFSAAGLAQVIELSVVNTTTTFTNQDLGSVVTNLVNNRDNASAVTFTAYTVAGNGPTVGSFTAGWGDAVYDDITKLMADYACDFEVRPDFTWGFMLRQGLDRPNYVVRYGDQGNISLDTTMHLVNSEMGNQIYWLGNSSSAVVANPSAAQYYGKKSVSIFDDGTITDLDALTRAQVELEKRQYPLFVLDAVQIIDTPLLPFSHVNLGDRILFECKGLPYLSSFNGLQRILAIDYDDVKRIMSLTLGNAVYVVERGKLHKIRLYT